MSVLWCWWNESMESKSRLVQCSAYGRTHCSPSWFVWADSGEQHWSKSRNRALQFPLDHILQFAFANLLLRRKSRDWIPSKCSESGCFSVILPWSELGTTFPEGCAIPVSLCIPFCLNPSYFKLLYTQKNWENTHCW